jgi:hypothetical protein
MHTPVIKLIVACAVCANALGSTCVVDSLTKVFPNSSCAKIPGATSAIDLAGNCLLENTSMSCGSKHSKLPFITGMRGERESVQLVISDQSSQLAAGVDISFSDLLGPDGSIIPSGSWTWYEVGFVDVKKTTRYAPSGGGWTPDPLLAPEQKGVLRTQTAVGNVAVVWLSLDIPRSAQAAAGRGKYTGTVKLGGAITIDVSVAVWPLLLPSPEALHRDFPEIWSFNVPNLQDLYGSNYSNRTKVGALVTF